MKQFILFPVIYKYENCESFCREFRIGKGDLVITNKRIYDIYLKSNIKEAAVLLKENYGNGNASDEIVEGMYEHIKRIAYERVIAIGGGSILNIGKLFALKHISPVQDLYFRKLEIIKEKELILVPTTCGSGSEATNVSSLELKAQNLKAVLKSDELYADSVIIIPEVLKSLPFEAFIASSKKALINAIDAHLSHKATTYTKMFSRTAIEIILNGYKKIIADGENTTNTLLDEFLLASNYAGIAFGNVNGNEVQSEIIHQGFMGISELLAKIMGGNGEWTFDNIEKLLLQINFIKKTVQN
ncbi:iron-containing alcohol dehydrogenase [Clostridium saccharoperbutylacetonicum]